MLVDKESLILSLYELGAISFGDHVLPSGEATPVDLDLHLLVSRPGTLRRVANMMEAYANQLTFDRIAAIPLAGLPIGVALSSIMECPLIYPRMQKSSHHDRGRYIEGTYRPGESVLMVDDVLTYGEGTIKAIGLLEMVRLEISNIFVVVDRQLGGAERLRSIGYNVHALLTLPEIIDTLYRARRLSVEQYDFLTARLDAAS